MPHSTSTAAPPMKPFSRSLQKDLDVAAADDDGKQYSADDGSGKHNSERGVRWPSRLFYLALIYTVFWGLVFYHHFSTSVQQSGSAAVATPAVLQLKPAAFFPVPRFFRRDPCAGRYVYMYDLPPRFNADIVRDCRRIPASSDVCKDVSNDGFGPPITGGGVGGSLPEQGAYDTDQFMLSIIFHARMRHYECLTADPAAATVVYIPFYAGLDAAIHLGNKDLAARDALSRDLMDWLVQRPEWRAMEGRDHLLVAGRGTWDFFRSPDAAGWGNTLMTYNPAIRNATFLNTEASARHGNDFAVQFPSHFHPSSDAQVTAWQDRMRRLDRAWLWCFAGWPRARGSGMGPERGEIIKQCGNSSRCSLLGKSTPGYYTPGHAMRLLESTEFCMQPRGDGYTRKSTFDSILAGCIPVFFHPVSAYLQYTWHLPRDYRSYSVYIHHRDVVGRNVSIEEVLRRIPPEKVARMRERVIQLIPTVMYRHPAAKGVTFKDAFDVTLDRVVDRVAKRRRAAAQGRRDYVDGVDGAYSWKYDLLEDGQTKIGPHEFDQYLG